LASGGETGDNKAKGFAALSTLVSTVDPEISQATKPAGTKASAKEPTKAAAPKAVPRPQEPQPSGNSFQPILWLLGIMIASAGGLYIYYNVSSNVSGGSSSQGSSYTSTTQQTPASTPNWQSAVVEPPVALRPFEEQPPIGRNLVLSRNQIRYCLAEEMRLEAAEPLLDNYNDAHVTEFNGYVDNYNSRCGEYQYYEESFAAARRDVVAFRDEIRAEGIARFSSPALIGLEVAEEVDADGFIETKPESEVPLEEPGALDTEESSDLEQFFAGTLKFREDVDSTPEAYDTVPLQDQPAELSKDIPATDIRPQNRVASAASPQSSGSLESKVRTAFPISPPRLTFPRRAAERGISGTCEVYFDLDARGKPMNVVAVCSNRLFQAEAERAIVQTEFVPKRVDGRPVEQRDMVYPLEFVLE
jgi:TonB family protein